VSESPPVTRRTAEFVASDGTRLVGDLAVPATPRAAAIVCHPHPRYGGNRFNNVVTAVFDALASRGVAALRFDFRSEFSEGVGERLDALAALDLIGAEVPDVPLVAVGYSFGALVALGLDDARVSALVLIAPPLAMTPDVPAPTVPTLLLTPAHDQFSPPSASAPIAATWTAAPVDHLTIEMADHSLVGHTATVADAIAAWIPRRP
jgi:hypothetical protein